MANTARVTQSFLIAGTLQNGTAKVTQSYLIVGVGLGLTCGNPPNGVVGLAYSHTFPSGGGVPPTTFSVVSGSLPSGLTLNSSTGVLSGTPSAAGAFVFTIQAADSMGAVVQVGCSITVTGPVGGSLPGAAHKCQESLIEPSRVTSHDWSNFVPIINAVRPRPLPETEYDTDDAEVY